MRGREKGYARPQPGQNQLPFLTPPPSRRPLIPTLAGLWKGSNIMYGPGLKDLPSAYPIPDLTSDLEQSPWLPLFYSGPKISPLKMARVSTHSSGAGQGRDLPLSYNRSLLGGGRAQSGIRPGSLLAFLGTCSDSQQHSPGIPRTCLTDCPAAPKLGLPAES